MLNSGACRAANITNLQVALLGMFAILMATIESCLLRIEDVEKILVKHVTWEMYFDLFDQYGLREKTEIW